MRVVLDTDVVLSAVLSPLGASRQWLTAGLRGEITMLVSVPLLFEYEAVLTRPNHLARAGASTADIGLLLDAVARRSEPVAISYLWRPSLRDPADEMVLEAAVNGGAEWIVTFNVGDYAGAGRFAIRVGQPGPAWRAFRGNLS